MAKNRDGDSGFDLIDVTTRTRISSEGGKAAHAYGTARKWTTDEAREAGRLGGIRSAEAKRKRKLAAR